MTTRTRFQSKAKIIALRLSEDIMKDRDSLNYMMTQIEDVSRTFGNIKGAHVHNEGNCAQLASLEIRINNMVRQLKEAMGLLASNNILLGTLQGEAKVILDNFNIEKASEYIEKYSYLLQPRSQPPTDISQMD